VKIVDLSRELYHRTPNYPGHPAIIHGIVMNIEDSPCTLFSASESSWVFQMPWMIAGWPG